MRIFTKKAFSFTNPNAGKSINEMTEKEVKQNLIFTKSMDFVDVPDWVQHDDMFKWAKADGDITIVEQATVVGGASASTASEKDIHKMKAVELYKMCKDAGIDCEERQSKAYYIELLEALEPNKEDEELDDTDNTEE